LRSAQRYHGRPAGLGQPRLDDPAEAQPSAPQARADRRHRHAEARGDLLVRQPVDVPQDERLAQARAHVGQRRQDVAVRQHVQVRRLPRRVGCQPADGRLEADLPDGNLVAVTVGEEVLHDSRQPGARVGAGPEPMTGAQRSLEGVLNQVLGSRLVAEQHLRVRE